MKKNQLGMEAKMQEQVPNSIFEKHADYTKKQPEVKIHGREYRVYADGGLSILGCPQSIEKALERLEKSE